MLIAIDIGNSSIKAGFFREGRLSVGRLDTHPLKSAAVYGESLRRMMGEFSLDILPRAGIISSVVPGHTEAMREALAAIGGCEPIVATAEAFSGVLTLRVERPEEVGVDRLAASAGAAALYGPPLAVVDFGTATTVNFVGTGGVFMGGAILPGLGLMREALFTRTAKLPDVEIAGQPRAIGRNTAENISSGILFGSAGAVERILREAEEDSGETFRVIVTGGFAVLAAPVLGREHSIAPDLTLEGLRVLYGKIGGRGAADRPALERR